MPRKFINSADVEVSTRGALAASVAAPVAAQGEKTVGAATVALVATSTPCSRVWIGAPTTAHTKAGPNAAVVLVGSAPGGNASGGVPLDPTNTAGFFYPVSDAAKVYLTGTAAGDAVEYQIFE